MYLQQFYKELDRERIAKDIRGEGFDPVLIINRPGYVYEEHQHPQTKILVFLEGAMEVTFGEKTYDCLPGDKIIIPGNTVHSAIVGNEGCTFYWSEKLL